MIRIEFSAEDIENLDYERYHHPSPKVQRKMEALYLKSQGMSHQDIRRICKTTLATYLKQYKEGGAEALRELHYKGRRSALNEHASSIEEYFREHLPRTTAEAQAAIEKLTGIKRSPTQIRAFMKRIGMK
jgi:transposase